MRVIDARREHVLGVEFEIARQIELEADVAVGSLADELIVEPYFRVVIDAVELNGHDFALVRGLKLEVLSMPADAARGVTVAAAVTRAERRLVAPTMRHTHGSPARLAVLKTGGHRINTPVDEQTEACVAKPFQAPLLLPGCFFSDHGGQFRQTRSR